MEPLVVLVAGADLDLSPLTKKLWAERIVHRVVIDEEGRQCLLLADSQDVPRVKEWVAIWQQGVIETTPPVLEATAKKEHVYLAMAQAPLSILTLLFLVLFFIWMQFDHSWEAWLTEGYAYWPDERFNPAVYIDMGLWSLWRPVLLHFSFEHIVFNGFWWWMLAPQIEKLDGKLPLLALILLCGLLGNLVQWWYAGPAFGGASGITTGMLGWVGVRLKEVPYPFPKYLLPAMLLIMLLSMGFDSLFANFSGTAHGAHIGGLIVGLILGLCWPKKLTSQAKET